MRKLLLVVGALLLGASPALAQTSTTYPPATTSTTAPSGQDEVVTQSLGVLREGDVRTVRSCGFERNSDVIVFFNESLVDESDEVDSAGCAEQILRIIEDGIAFAPRSLAAVGAGSLDLAQTGTSTTPVVEIDGKRFTARANAQNVIQNIGFSPDGDERFVRTLFSIGGGTSRGRGGALARTGATAVRWGLPGTALVGVGALLVLAAKRRNATR